MPTVIARPRNQLQPACKCADYGRKQQSHAKGQRRDHDGSLQLRHAGWGPSDRSYSITDCNVSSNPTFGSQLIAARILSSDGIRRGMSSKFSPYASSYGTNVIGESDSVSSLMRSASSTIRVS